MKERIHFTNKLTYIEVMIKNKEEQINVSRASVLELRPIEQEF